MEGEGLKVGEEVRSSRSLPFFCVMCLGERVFLSFTSP